ncbi:hypothetical protein [Maribacter sp. 2304DJ31-5]
MIKKLFECLIIKTNAYVNTNRPGEVFKRYLSTDGGRIWRLAKVVPPI